MKFFILSLTFLLSFFQLKSQCFEIESILVDACDGSNEGQNEMVIFKVGSVALNTSNLTVSWPANTWRGICQNAGTAADVAAVNLTISNCGYLKEPVGGVLKANSRVLLVAGTSWNPMAQSFTNLSDTLIVIFQCFNSGNVGGHFANYNSATTPSVALRSLTMSFSPTCTDVVTYNRTNLLQKNQTIGAEDGGAVEFTPSGLATYVNRDCQVPFTPTSVDAGTDKIICAGSSQTFSATAQGTYSTINWSLGAGATGTFSPANSLTTSYTPGVGETGTVKLYCSIIKACGSQTVLIKDSVNLTIGSLPTVTVTSNNISLCSGQSSSVQANANTAVTYSWSTGATTNTVSLNTNGVYTVNVANGCGNASATVSVSVGSSPSVFVTASQSSLCANETSILSLTGSVGTYLWSNGATTATTSVANAGVYSVTVTTSCGPATSSIAITAINVDAIISANPTSGVKPVVVNFVNNSTGATTYLWDFGNGKSSLTQTVSSQTYSVPGTYTVYLTASNGSCSDMDFVIIRVLNEEPVLVVPNVFTPNNDSVNDVFKVSGSNIIEFNCSVFNRWGLKLYSWNDINKGWDGKTNGKNETDGTYFYMINAKDINDKEIKKQGYFQLFK